MHPLTHNDIESELSYAYLHAVATHARASCTSAPRTMDANGIDAILTAWGPFDRGGPLEEVDLKIQLKATSVPPMIQNGHFSYWVKDTDRYNDLRKETLHIHRLLVVLFLPEHIDDWLAIDDDQLLLKKCAYWVSLRGAPDPAKTGKTIYIPQRQRFDTINLRHIFAALSRNEKLVYSEP
jgi:hypothetical protein